MAYITRQPSLLESASEVLDEGIERARGAIQTVADAAGEVVEGIDPEPLFSALSARDVKSSARDLGSSARDLGSNARDALAGLRTSDNDCSKPVEVAKDDERLKSAVIAGVVLFAASAVVFLVARQIATRRAERRRRELARARRAQSRVEPGAAA